MRPDVPQILTTRLSKVDYYINGNSAYAFQECFNLGQAEVVKTDMTQNLALNNAGMVPMAVVSCLCIASR